MKLEKEVVQAFRQDLFEKLDKVLKEVSDEEPNRVWLQNVIEEASDDDLVILTTIIAGAYMNMLEEQGQLVKIRPLQKKRNVRYS